LPKAFTRKLNKTYCSTGNTAYMSISFRLATAV
jgi:hypothetical protein